MAQQVLHYWQFYAAFHEVSCKRMAQRMDAALASHTALFQRAVIDVLLGVSTHRFARFFAEEEPRTVMTRFTLTLRSPVVF
jgi:hypothetical protein